jgi:hypothetical protein
LHRQPFLPFIVEREFVNGCGFRRLRVRRLDRSEIMAALLQQRHAPAAEFSFGGFFE